MYPSLEYRYGKTETWIRLLSSIQFLNLKNSNFYISTISTVFGSELYQKTWNNKMFKKNLVLIEGPRKIYMGKYLSMDFLTLIYFVVCNTRRNLLIRLELIMCSFYVHGPFIDFIFFMKFIDVELETTSLWIEAWASFQKKRKSRIFNRSKKSKHFLFPE